MTPCVPLGCVAGEGDAHRARARDLLLARMSSHESVQCSGEFPALHGPVAENESRPVPSVFVDLTVSSHAAGASQHQQDVVSQRAPSQPPRDCVDPVARSERTEAYRVAAACHEAAKAIESVAKALQGAVKVDQPESKANQEATKVKDLDSQALRASVAAVGRGDSSRARKLKSQLGHGQILIKVEPKAASSETAPVADEKHAVLKLPERTTSTPEAYCCKPLLLRQGPPSSSTTRIRASPSVVLWSNRSLPQKPIDRPDHESQRGGGRSMVTSAGTNHTVASSLGVRGPPPASDLRIDSKRAQELRRRNFSARRRRRSGVRRLTAPTGRSTATLRTPWLPLLASRRRSRGGDGRTGRSLGPEPDTYALHSINHYT
jgi:hypothetical protein